MDIKIGSIKLGKRPIIAAALSDKDVKLLKPDDISRIDLIELRIDMFKNLSESYVIKIFSNLKAKTSKPVIATIRHISEGGSTFIDEDKRYTLFKAVISIVDAIDIEIQTKLFNKIVKLSHNYKKPIIASYHNLKKAPDDAFLLKMLSKSGHAAADITKIALKVRNMNDVARLLFFTFEHRKDNLITISMGDAGRISRVINPLFGSLITYGYIGNSTAEGQMHVKQLAEQLMLYSQAYNKTFRRQTIR